jgi:hypothetical protein
MELTAYVVSDPADWRIEPAPLERDWMNDTPSRFAYRCLPLVMANQAGWVVRCPVGFRARWNGSPEAHESIDLNFERDAAKWATWISSHFGSGVLTFSMPWLFRTPRPMLLRVSGPPNWWKEDAIPLEGLVETFWSPYTFTMNWKMIRPGACVAFGEGDPICFIQPVDAALADALQPKFRPIAENAALKREFDEWTKARTSLIHDPHRGKEWQKNYFQGKLMSGAQEAEHRSRLNVRAFE